MKQSKFSLADVLTVLTALVFGFICFLGKNFLTLGNTSASITWGVIIAVSLAGTAFIAKLLKRTSRNFRTNFILEIVVLLLFTCLTVFFAYSSFPHYFNVSAKKTEIQKKFQTSITQAQNMFAAYEQYAERRISNYKGDLETAVAIKGIDNKKYKEYGFYDGTATDYQKVKNKMFVIRSDLYPTTYSDTVNKIGIKEVATAWLSKAERIKNNWNPISIVQVVNEIEKNSTYWLNQLITFSKVREKGEQTLEFDYPLFFDDVKTYFTTTGKPTPLTISLAVMAYLLMLLSWFVTKRDSRSIGASGTASYEVIL